MRVEEYPDWVRKVIVLTRRLLLPTAAGIGLLLACGCTNPISAQKVSFSRAFAEANVSALSGETYSSETRLVLRRFDLEGKFVSDPAGTLQELHRRACTDERRDLLFALAELSYLHGHKLYRTRMLKPWEPKPAQDYFLCSAIYAYHYLFGGPEEFGSGFDPQFRPACDLYNRALARAFVPDGDTNGVVKLGSQTRNLPPGRIKVEFGQAAFPWSLEEFDQFLAA